jgi:replicative DNA helicase
MLLVGCFYKEPDLYIKYGQFIRSKYDFADEAMKFFYDCFELMYKTFSQTVDEFKVNTFMTQDTDRFKTYNTFGRYDTIKKIMSICDINDIDNYFETVKKYSLVREYYRKGYPVEKLIQHPRFQSMTAEQVYKTIKAGADKISTVILCNKESSVINSGISDIVSNYLISPQMGLVTPWHMFNEMFRGCRLGKVVFDGLLSNEGKTRKLMLLAAYITMVKNEKFFLASNEMDEEDLRSCLITTVLNNKEFKEVHGINIVKKEREIVLGLYKDDITNEFLYRLKDDDGNYIESEDEYIKRVNKNSKEYKMVQEVAKWVDSKRETQLFFKDVGMDYSDTALEFEFRKHQMIYGIKYGGYDTLKGFGTDDWQTVKQSATKLKELMKEIKMFLYAVFQLTDDAIYTDVFDLSSNNIANCKQIKHITDHLSMGKRLNKEDYHKYKYIPIGCWGESAYENLNPNKTYYGVKVDKNRGGNKNGIMLFDVDLDYNTWGNVGVLVKSNHSTTDKKS